MIIRLRGGNERNDCHSVLSPVAWRLLKDYRRRHDPWRFAFEGREPGHPHSERMQESMHSLRHGVRGAHVMWYCPTMV